jgi:hypothetical protein
MTVSVFQQRHLDVFTDHSLFPNLNQKPMQLRHFKYDTTHSVMYLATGAPEDRFPQIENIFPCGENRLYFKFENDYKSEINCSCLLAYLLQSRQTSET